MKINTIKKSIKYFIVAIANGVVLTVLLALWTDKIEMTFNELVRPIEFLKIIGCGILALIVMRILVSVFRKKNIKSVRTKMKIASLFTLLISLILYVPYFIKIVDYRIVNGRLRNNIGSKIKPADFLANGSKAYNLTGKEYELVSKVGRFPKLPKEADHIAYMYSYDGFLPDFMFTLKYELPKNVHVDTINLEKGDFSKHQSFEIKGDRKIVFYEEGER